MRISLLVAASLLPVLSSTTVLAADKKLDSSLEKFSYAVGFQIGQSLKRDGVKVDVEAMSMAVKDVLDDKEPRVSMQQMQAAFQTFQEQQQKDQQVAADANLKKGQEFLEKNKKKKGVKETASGLQYEVIKAGNGKKPSATDSVVVHYRGTTIDGKEFDSSYSRNQPTPFTVNQVIPGWQEALQMMETGAKWKVYIPSKLAYGPQGAGGAIGPNETLVFEVELIEVK